MRFAMRLETFKDSQKDLWDGFVGTSKNGTFLFYRDYMDYHRDRFVDHSLLFWDDKERLVALLPANQEDDTLISHSGLTYGGFITDASMKTPKMLEVFEVILAYLQENSFSRLIYKTIPHIYHRYPAEEDRYALFLCDAVLLRRGVLTAVDNRQILPFQERRNRMIRKAERNGLIVRPCGDYDTYWHILTERLFQSYNAQPVHSLTEIQLLQSRFPHNIKLFACFEGSSMIGGVVIFESDHVVRAQYIAANKRGLKLGAIDIGIFSYLW